MITGWITNKGKIIETEPYKHFDVNDETLKSIWEKHHDNVERAAETCEYLESIGEHPEWHVYEMALSDCTYLSYKNAYNLGYLRISPFNRTGEAPMIAVQGLEKFIEAHKSVIKELSDKYGCRIKTFIK